MEVLLLTTTLSLWSVLEQFISLLPPASVQPVATFTLAYNEEYTVSIAATNCVGTGGTVSLNISQSEGEHTHCELPVAGLAISA